MQHVFASTDEVDVKVDVSERRRLFAKTEYVREIQTGENEIVSFFERFRLRSLSVVAAIERWFEQCLWSRRAARRRAFHGRCAQVRRVLPLHSALNDVLAHCSTAFNASLKKPHVAGTRGSLSVGVFNNQRDQALFSSFKEKSRGVNVAVRSALRCAALPCFHARSLVSIDPRVAVMRGRGTRSGGRAPGAI
mgnify:CR=1 FL=1